MVLGIWGRFLVGFFRIVRGRFFLILGFEWGEVSEVDVLEGGGYCYLGLGGKYNWCGGIKI